MPANHEYFMRLAIEEAARGGAEGNSAVGSVIVRGSNIVGVGRNLVTSSTIPRPMLRRWPCVRLGPLKATRT